MPSFGTIKVCPQNNHQSSIHATYNKTGGPQNSSIHLFQHSQFGEARRGREARRGGRGGAPPQQLVLRQRTQKWRRSLKQCSGGGSGGSRRRHLQPNEVQKQVRRSAKTPRKGAVSCKYLRRQSRLTRAVSAIAIFCDESVLLAPLTTSI